MYMKKLLNIQSLIFTCCLLFAGCSDNAELLEDQQASIVTFLTSKHKPKLINENEVGESLDIDPEFYTVSERSIYRYIRNYYSDERDSRATITNGATISLTFWCYDFSAFSIPTDSYLYYTNDPVYEAPLKESGLNTEYWDFKPLQVTLGRGEIIKGIESALVGCKERDTVEFYLTYNMGYNNEIIGVTNFEKPTAFFCTIDSIDK